MFRPPMGHRPAPPPLRRLLRRLAGAPLPAADAPGRAMPAAAQRAPMTLMARDARADPSRSRGPCTQRRVGLPAPARRPTARPRAIRALATAATATTATAGVRLPDLDRVVALVRGARDRLLACPGLPTEEETAAALRVCAEAADLIMDAAVQPQLSSRDHQADTAASALLSMDGSSGAHSGAPPEAATTAPAAPARLRDAVDEIADAAYAVIADRRVFIAPALLARYVAIQARLARPASLPRVLELYATKPLPRRAAGGVRFVAQNPRSPSSAVAPEVAAQALAAALAARSLDAAVGVVETTYAAPAFVRAKVLRRGLLPGLAAVGVPLATYGAAAQLAAYQQTLETGTATAFAFVGILAYIGFTGAIGVVANTTANDQMRRVTWAPGTPLRERWLREDERAALDTVACAFGFSEADRYGEEEGAEFQALREYIMRKGMLLDQVELMAGMSS